MVKDYILLHWDQLSISSHIAGQDMSTEENEKAVERAVVYEEQ